MQSTFLGKPVAGDRALIMAIVNRTPDSFYDRGATFTDDAAKEAVHRVVEEGADVVDVGDADQAARLVNTTLAFEYSSVDADVHGTIDSVFNPSSGTIRADHINELTLDPAKIDPTATTIVTADAAERAGAGGG